MSSLWRLHPCIPVTWITHLNVTTLQWIFVWIEGNFCKTAIVQTCFLGFPNCCTIMIPFTESRNKSLMNHPKRNKITQLTIQDAQCIFFFNLHVSFTIIYSQKTIQMLVKIGQSHGSHGARCCSRNLHLEVGIWRPSLCQTIQRAGGHPLNGVSRIYSDRKHDRQQPPKS